MSAVARLFKEFQPNNYNLKIILNESNLKFSGKETILGKLTKKSLKYVKLHASGLNVTSASINGHNAKISLNGDELRLDVDSALSGEIEINIAWDGEITRAMHGIYPTKTKSGDTLFATQFESHHAREAFPCIDEPEAKATFDITLETNDVDVLGNMPIVNCVSFPGNRKKTIFQTTPIMSTYLVAFVTGKMQRVSTNTSNGTEISVWSSQDHDIESLVFPLEVAVKTTEFFNDYFGVDYPLPKCDHVALPDFSSGAMENWGLITYREMALLADPDTISTSSKELIATVIAHEISHQWFGNLVTMKWWDDLWLNESFATLMEYLVIDAIYPDWNVMTSFAAGEALGAFRRDILPGVQPVMTAVNHPDEISTLFDPSIVYAKGARLLLMAYSLVGDKAFRKGLNNYFKSHAYANSVGSDLWNALSKASGKDVASIMEPWIVTAGYPFITVSRNKLEEITLHQQQLLTTSNNSQRIWPIPLWPSKRLPNTIFDKAKLTIKAPSPIRLNTVGGHYVTKYEDPKDLAQIFKSVQNGTLSPHSRLLVLHDLVLLAKCHKASLSDALEALNYYQLDKEESVWSVIQIVLADTRMLIEGDLDTEARLRELIWHLIQPNYQELGWLDRPDDTANDKKLRSSIISLAIYSEQQDTIAKALEIYNSSKDITDLPSDIRGSILAGLVKVNQKGIFNKLLKSYPNVKQPDISLDITGALCSTKQSENIDILISKLKDDKFIRHQDLERFVIYLLKNRFSRDKTWDWLVTNWQWISDVFSSDKSYDSYPRYAATAFSTTEGLKKYKSLFNKLKDEPALTRNITLGIMDIENKISWRQADQKKVTDTILSL